MACARAADRTRIIDIDNEIAQLELSLRTLRSERDAITDRLMSYKYPVSTLPNEILAVIFVHFLPAYPSCSAPHMMESPTRLMAICRQWRDLAISTPVLWRALSLSDIENSHVKTWLNRSGSLPLSIRMTTYSQGALDTILPSRHRWEYIALYLRSTEFLRIVGPFPLLRDLDIVPWEYTPKAPEPIKGVPCLHSVKLWRFPIPENYLPWAQLTSLNLVAATTESYQFALRQACNLVHCTLSLWGADDQLPPESDIDLPRLESLVLMDFEEDHPHRAPYLQAFLVPSLRSLQIPDVHLKSQSSWPGGISNLKLFIKKSRCKLELLRITGPLSIPKQRYRNAFASITEISFDVALVDYSSIVMKGVVGHPR